MADPAQLSQQLAETIHIVRGLQGRLESQEQELQILRAERAQARRLTTESDLELGPVQPPGAMGNGHGQAASSELPRGLVHTRQLGKPDKFSGEPTAFEDWSFVLEAYMCCVNRGFQALFERIRYSDVPVSQAHLTRVEAELSTQLFYTLVLLLQGRGLDIAQNTDLGNGLEVYRKLVSEYRPRLASRFVGTLTSS